MIALQRALAVLDIESTGTDPVNDRIVELAIVLLLPDGRRKQFYSQFNPERPIPPEATAVHHITDEMIQDAPPFRDVAPRIHAALLNKDLAGYNLRSLDLPILDEEFRRCNLKLDLATTRVIDCFGIFANKEPRDLSAAVRRFCGREHTGAHGALADTLATLDVLEGQLAAYPDLAAMDMDALAEASQRSNGRKQADLAGKLYFNSAGVLCYGFGKHRDKPVAEHPDYAEWMIQKDFPQSTKDVLGAELERISQQAPMDFNQEPQAGSYQATDGDVPF